MYEVVTVLDRVVASITTRIIVVDSGLSAHVAGTKELFLRLQTTISSSKVSTGAADMDFLRPTIFPASFKGHATKVEALTKLPMPDDTKQLRSLMIGIGSYRKFLRSSEADTLALLANSFTGTSPMNGIVREHLEELLEPPVLMYQ